MTADDLVDEGWYWARGGEYASSCFNVKSGEWMVVNVLERGGEMRCYSGESSFQVGHFDEFVGPIDQPKK